MSTYSSATRRGADIEVWGASDAHGALRGARRMLEPGERVVVLEKRDHRYTFRVPNPDPRYMGGDDAEEE